MASPAPTAAITRRRDQEAANPRVRASKRLGSIASSRRLERPVIGASTILGRSLAMTTANHIRRNTCFHDRPGLKPARQTQRWRCRGLYRTPLEGMETGSRVAAFGAGGDHAKRRQPLSQPSAPYAKLTVQAGNYSPTPRSAALRITPLRAARASRLRTASRRSSLAQAIWHCCQPPRLVLCPCHHGRGIGVRVCSGPLLRRPEPS